MMTKDIQINIHKQLGRSRPPHRNQRPGAGACEAKEVEAKELVDATLAKELEVQVLVASWSCCLREFGLLGPESEAGCGLAWGIA